ncbi:MAG: choice-of-anchor J domain-containing protein [Flavobacteriales bacterium]|nr:choice-of-anchor J domain-containing protein [Flavobacteriales bacterium]
MRSFTTLILSALLGAAQAQTVLFNEDFEGTPAFTLNTTDVSSVAGGQNLWLVNNVYTGGAGSITCFGFPLPFSVPNTAGQPAGISSPNGNYMHISSQAAVSSGVLCASFVAADGLCATAANHFTRMNTDVSTVGAGDVTLSFWWLCGGGTNNYGEVYYSTNSGTSWNLVATAPGQYRNQQSWVQQSISLPEFSGQATLRFGFRFFNGVTASAQDPGFSVDDVRITSAQSEPTSVSTGALVNEVCAGAAIQVPYTSVGNYQAGNVFTAELSDAAGNFGTAVTIGSVASTTSGTINATIPPGTVAGAGYRIRVSASAPLTVGSPGPGTLVIGAAPFAGLDQAISFCKNSGTYNLFDYLGTGVSTCGSWTGPEGVAVGGVLNTATDNGGLYTYNTNCPGGCPQDQAVLTITLVNPANAGQDVNTSLCSNAPPAALINLVQGGEITGFFFQNGLPFQLGALSTPGIYTPIYVVYADQPCTNDTANFSITVNAPPNAGTSTTATLCVNAPAQELLSLLNGADAGGAWTGPTGLPFSGTFNPASDVSGLYSYQVNGIPPCANATSFVAMVVDPCTGVDERDGVALVRWAGQVAGGVHQFTWPGAILREWALYDAAGSLVPSVRVWASGERMLLDMGGAGTGVYLMRFRTDAGVQVVRLLHEGR